MDTKKSIFYRCHLSKENQEDLQALLQKCGLDSVDIRDSDLNDGVSPSTPKVEINLNDLTAILNQFCQKQEMIQDLQKKIDLALHRVAQLKKESKKADIVKNQFFSNMSHEIRTPLNAIIGMTDLLIDTDLNADQADFAETVRTSSKSLHYFVNELLDFSKLEKGHLDIEIIDFDFRVAIEEVVDMNAARAFSKWIEFSCMIDHRIPSMLRGDPGRLRQILSLLTDNAIKFTEQGSVTIDVKFIREVDQLVSIRFEIKDTGMGIKEEDMEKILTPFTQADPSTTRTYGGIGLGLTLSRRLIDLMDGSFDISSSYGKGTCVTVNITFEKQHNQTELLSPCTHLKGKHFLIVDENDSNRYVLREMLRLWSCTFDEVKSGELAQKKLQEENNTYDAIILDMELPDMTSIDLVQELSENESFRNIKILMLTSIGQRGDAVRMKEMGVSGYLTRPVRHAVMHDTLLELFNVQDNLQASEQHGTLVTKYSVQENKKRRMRILLVEDSIVNQQIASKIIEKLGFRVDVTSNGEEALCALEDIPYDIVFMDVQMPVMDGLEATLHIRKGTRKTLNPTIPIIAMTAHTFPGIQKQFQEAGMNGTIIKPIHPNDILKCIKETFSNPPVPKKSKIKEKPKTESIYDRESLLNRLEGDEELCQDIVNDFLNDIPDLTMALKTAIDQKDHETISSIAFTIKEGAADISSKSIMDICERIESAGKAKEIETSHALFLKFKELVKQFSETVKGNRLSVSGANDFLILVVEDEPTNQKLMAQILKKKNYSFQIVGKGMDAISAMKSCHFDLVFMDVQLPGMDGMETTRCIRSEEPDIINPGVPIIAVSAHALQEDKALFISAGMDDFIEKPIKQDILFGKIEFYMNKQSTLPPLPVNSTVCFDREELMERIGHDQNIYESTVRFFKSHVSELLEQIKAAIDSKNSQDIETIAHTIKGVTANMSAKGMSAIALEMENAVKDNHLDQTPELLNQLKEQFNLIKKCF
ncbi:MAG: response regulator [Candidatus Magnetomorum sp.]|nr:response regulator [Candidatus Magnetomorum sp.]